MKFNSGIVPLLFIVPMFWVSSALADVEEEFRICAAAALESQLSDSSVIHVDLSRVNSVGASQVPAPGKVVRLELDMVDKASGNDLGDVVCLLDSSGNLISAKLSRPYIAMN